MADLTITTDKELMVALVEGTTSDGEAFVNNYLIARMIVLDSDRIIIRLDDLDDLTSAAVHLSIVTRDATARSLS